LPASLVKVRGELVSLSGLELREHLLGLLQPFDDCRAVIIV